MKERQVKEFTKRRYGKIEQTAHEKRRIKRRGQKKMKVDLYGDYLYSFVDMLQKTKLKQG